MLELTCHEAVNLAALEKVSKSSWAARAMALLLLRLLINQKQHKLK